MAESGIPLYIVTGASCGIGRATAIALAARGHRVVVVARSLELLKSLVNECGSNVDFVAADLATPEGVEQVALEVAGETDIAGIVHAAGSLVQLEPFSRIEPKELVEHFRIHVGAPMAIYRALAESSRIKRMLFIDSYSATTGRLGWAAYSIVKAAAQMAARCAAQELPDTTTIRVFPGAVNTRIVETVLASKTPTASVFAGMLERDEFSQPEQAAAFIAALLVDASDELLSSRSAWDYNNPDDRSAIDMV